MIGRSPERASAAGLWEAAAAGALLLVGVLPLVILGEDAYFTIHDNLDSELLWLIHLVENGIVFDYSALIPKVMNGLPRAALRSGLNGTLLFFHLFDPWLAYVLNAATVRAVAFCSMLLLLRRHILPAEHLRPAASFLSLLFALLPFYTLYGLSVAALPLLLSAYIDIVRGRGRKWSWLVVIVYPFYSILYLTGLFAVVLFSLYAAYASIEQRRPAYRAVAPALVLVLGYVIVEWPLIEGIFFNPSWISHRVEIDRATSSAGVLSAAASMLLYGSYHAAELVPLPIAAATLLAWRWRSGRTPSTWKYVFALLGGLIAITVLHAAYRPIVGSFLGDAFPVLEMVQFDRFYFFLPVLWFLVFAFVLGELSAADKGWVGYGLLVVQAALIFYFSPEIRNNVVPASRGDLEPSYREFYDPELFEVIRNEIGRPQEDYRVVAVGLHPAVLQFNGFYTLDSYQNNYPLSYKHAFRPIIADELDKAPSLRRYFDDWGNRCYVFSSELGRNYLWHKNSTRTVTMLSIDIGRLLGMGASHLLASVPIENHDELGLELVGAFESPRSYWRIHLYRLDRRRPGVPDQPLRPDGAFGAAGADGVLLPAGARPGHRATSRRFREEDATGG